MRAEPGSSATETRTPTQTDDSTPTAAEVPNETEYPVDHPNERKGEHYGPLIDHDYGGVHPIRSREEWRRLVTEGPAHGSADEFLDYGFVTQTDFDTETVVVVEQGFNGGETARLQSVDGVGTPHLWLEVRRAGTATYNAIVQRYVFVRLPTDGTEIEGITVVVGDENRKRHYAYRDSRCHHQNTAETASEFSDPHTGGRRMQTMSTALHGGEQL